MVQGDAGDDRVTLVGVIGEYGMPLNALNVRASGGEGSDTYAFEVTGDSRYRGQLTVTDFKPGAGGDVLDLFGLVIGSFPQEHGNPFGESGLLRAEQSGADTLIYVRAETVPKVVLLGVSLGALTGENFRGYWNPSGSPDGLSVDGDAGNDTFAGTGLNDTISGLAGNDALVGAAGDDLLDGGSGNDRLDGGDGSDSLAGGEGNDFLFDDGTDGINLLDGGAGEDMLVSGRFGPSTLIGGDGDDALVALVGSDTLSGGSGHDAFAFLGVSNTIYGGLTMSATGGEGNDHFISWESTSHGPEITFTGGAGTDVYHVAWPATDSLQRVTITDFKSGPGGDQIDLRALGHGDPLRPGWVTLLQQSLDTIVEVPGSSFRLLNVNANQLTPSNFIVIDMAEGGLQLSGSGTITGSALDDRLSGGFSTDTISGGAGRDRIDGCPGPDQLDGGAGSDLQSGGRGVDTIYGGAGIDWVLLPHAAWSMEREGSSWVMTDLTIANERDILYGVERVLLPSERAIALDIEGDAGTVFRLYQAAFHHTPDLAGMGYWLSVADKGFGFDAMAAHFMQSPEFASMYGNAPTNRDLVRLFYVNALHREPDQAGLDFWTGVLDRGGASVGQVLMGFSDSAENRDATATLVGNGIPFIPYGGV